MRKFLTVALLVVVVFLLSCDEKYPLTSDAPATVSISGCTDCHLNSDMLKAVATPLPPDTASSGEG